jgi:transglutaminase-like putative cysteine protease
MNESPTQEHITTYPESGMQTEITPEIIAIAQRCEGTVQEKVHHIMQFLRTLKYETDTKDEVFRKRTASQIIADGYVTGCTDDALVFIALARASGIPTTYIETVDLDWLTEGGRPIRGHVYARVEDGDEQRIVDPSARNEHADLEQDGRVVIAEGLDSWDIGASDFETLAHMQDRFREAYVKK